MSTTFFCPEAPTVKGVEECYCIQDPQDVASPDCPWCHGSGTVPTHKATLPEINLAEANAKAILELISINSRNASGGQWEAHKLADVRQRILYLLNADGATSSAEEQPRYERGVVRTTSEDGLPQITPGCRVYHGGRSPEYLRDRLTSLLELVIKAQEQRYAILWG